jgi:aminopeptidase-like protein
MHALATKLFPICRSITGDGARQTLKIIGEHIPLTLHEVPSGTKAFDWTVPKEWNIRDAYIADASGKRVVDFKKNNLHVVSYSTPVDATLSRAELEEHLHSLPEQPTAIPYLTSYYKESWGFCLSENDRKSLNGSSYHVVIDSDLKDGSLTYGELIIPGKKKEEIFLSTYICHPSMANNELSGPVVATYLAKYLMSAPRAYSYRIIFVPETIGSLVYLSRNLKTMKKRVIAGFNMTCMGDDRAYSFMPTRAGDTFTDKVAQNVLGSMHPEFKKYSYLARGSDERQYCSPGVDLPVVSVMRSKYGEYPEYHTSLDDLTLVTPSGLAGAYDAVRECIDLIEINAKYRATCLGEPQLGKRGLYPKEFTPSTTTLMNVLAYADGKSDIFDISNKICAPAREVAEVAKKLVEHKLLEAVN